MDGKADDADINIRALIFALLALACGHMLSTLLRTIPAISLDVMAADFAHAAADAGEPDLDLSFRLRRLANSGRRRDGSLRRPAGFPEPARRNHRRCAGVGASHRAGEFSVRPVPARRRHLGHADVPDDAGRQADVGGALWPVVRASSCRSAISACCCRRARWPLSSNSGDGARDFGSRPVSARWWQSPCSRWSRSNRPRMPISSSPLSQMAEVLRIGLSRPLRGLIALALVSLAASLVLRGLWGGPWLMEIKALGRIEAGNDARPVHARLDRRAGADGDSRSQHRPSPRSCWRPRIRLPRCCSP